MKSRTKWILIVFLLTFGLSIFFGFITNIISNKFGLIASIILMLLVTFLGISFDMIGASSLTSNEASFHAKSSKKIKGAKEAITLIKNNDKVSSVCNDIIGDICGIVSGGLGAVVALNIAQKFNLSTTMMSIIITAVVSSLTVGGKAIFKQIAIKYADNILFSVSRLLTIFKK